MTSHDSIGPYPRILDTGMITRLTGA